MGLLYSNYETNNTLKINACSGGIYKTYKESWFDKFHLRSAMADSLFNPNGSTIVLQMVLCGENEVMAELIKKEDFDKYLKIEPMVEKEND